MLLIIQSGGTNGPSMTASEHVINCSPSLKFALIPSVLSITLYLFLDRCAQHVKPVEFPVLPTLSIFYLTVSRNLTVVGSCGRKHAPTLGTHTRRYAAPCEKRCLLGQFNRNKHARRAFTTFSWKRAPGSCNRMTLLPSMV